MHACLTLVRQQLLRVSQCAQTGVQELENGWRISLGLAIVPAVIFIVGSLICPDTPASTLYQDQSATEKARKVRNFSAADHPFWPFRLQYMSSHVALLETALPKHLAVHAGWIGSPAILQHLAADRALLAMRRRWSGCAARRTWTRSSSQICANVALTHSDSLLGSAKALFSRGHAKQAVASGVIPLAQQFTGMNAIMVRGSPAAVPLMHRFSCALLLW